MMIKISLFIAIVLLLCVSHLCAVTLGSFVKDKTKTPEERLSSMQWCFLFIAAPWAVALLLIAVMAA